MPEEEQKNQSSFMIEKIKDRPINKKKLIRRTLTTALMAVIFGLIACVTFLLLEPIINNWLYPEEEPQVIIFPEDLDEMTPEQMLSENMQQENQNSDNSEMLLEQEQIKEILDQVVIDKDSYRQMYSVLSQYVSELDRCMVTITGVTSNIDWFNDIQESSNQTSGAIIANNGRDLLILTEYTPLKKAEVLKVTFYNSLHVSAVLKNYDDVTGLAIIAVSLDDLPENYLEDGAEIAALGSSNYSSIVGTPVIAVGSPMGTSGSLGYGMISSLSGQLTDVDTNYKLLQTDIAGSQNAGGILFNLQGQIVGIITNSKSSDDMKNVITAYGISELRGKIQKMSNNGSCAYMGITGLDVTVEAHDDLGVPYGAYVKSTAIDSPAMLAGIRQGDVIIRMDEKSITNFGEYVSTLLQLNPEDSVELTVMRQTETEYKEIKFNVVPNAK